MTGFALDRDDMMEAISEGVRRGFYEAATASGAFDRPNEFIQEGVRQGVRDAIWRVATNATQMPCEDFFKAIHDGVREGMIVVSDAEMP